MKLSFGLRALLIGIVLFSAITALYVNWLLPWKRQQAVYETPVNGQLGVIGDFCSMERIDELPSWKRAIANLCGEHSVSKVVSVDLEAGYDFGIESVKHFPHLRKLSISGIDPIENGYHQIFKLRELEELTFSRTSLNDLTGFRSLKQLRKFGLYDLTRAETGAGVFGELQQLVTLHLGEMNVNQEQLDGIFRSRSIEDLSFSIDATSVDLRGLSQMIQLRKIRIRRSRKCRFDLDTLLTLPNIQMVEIQPKLAADDVVLAELQRRGVEVR